MLCIVLAGGEWKRRGSHEYLASPWDTNKDWRGNKDAGNVYNFRAARGYCQARGADLASIHDQDTMDWLLSNILPVYTRHLLMNNILPVYTGGWLMTNILPVHTSRSCYYFWVGLHKPTGDACTDDGCQRYSDDSSACRRCRSGWTWTDGSSYGSWERGWWGSDDPDSGERYGFLGGCDSYRLYSYTSSYGMRALCMRDADPPDVSSDFSSLTSSVENDVYAFTCSASRIDPRLTFTWQLSGRILPATDSPSSSMSRSILRYAFRRTDDGKTLSCTPVWEGRELTRYRQSTRLQIIHVRSDLRNVISVPEGDVSILSCTVYPPASFIWLLDGRRLTAVASPAPGSGTQSVLRYTGLAADDGKNLTCIPVWEGRHLTKLSRSTTLSITLEPAIDGGWSCWSEWSPCSNDCGSGTRNRSRQCNNPVPAHGGSNCSGSGSETQTCSTTTWPAFVIDKNYLGSPYVEMTNFSSFYSQCTNACESFKGCTSVIPVRTLSKCQFFHKNYDDLLQIYDQTNDTAESDLAMVYGKDCAAKGPSGDVRPDLRELDYRQMDYGRCGDSLYVSAQISRSQAGKHLLIRKMIFNTGDLLSLIGSTTFTSIQVYCQVLIVGDSLMLNKRTTSDKGTQLLTIYSQHLHYENMNTSSVHLITVSRSNGNIELDYKTSSCSIDEINADCNSKMPFKHLYNSGSYWKREINIYFVTQSGIGESELCAGSKSSTERNVVLDEIFVTLSLGCASMLHNSGNDDDLLKATYIIRYITLLRQSSTNIRDSDPEKLLKLKDQLDENYFIVSLAPETHTVPVLSPEGLLSILETYAEDTKVATITQQILKSQNAITQQVVESQNAITTHLQNVHDSIETVLNKLLKKVTDNHKQILQIQINNEQKSIKLETKRIEVLEEERRKYKQEMSTLRKKFENSSKDIGNTQEDFEKGIETYKTKMILTGVFGLLEDLGNLASSICSMAAKPSVNSNTVIFNRNTLINSNTVIFNRYTLINSNTFNINSKRKRSTRDGLAWQHSVGPEVTLEAHNNLTSWKSTRSTDVDVVLEREKRFVSTTVLSIGAAVAAVAGIAKTCIAIHDAHAGYETAKNALKTMKELSNIDLDTAESEYMFKVIRDEAQSVLTGGVLNIAGASTYKAAIMRMCNYGEAYVTASKNMQTILNKLVISKMSIDESEKLEAQYTKWLREANSVGNTTKGPRIGQANQTVNLELAQLHTASYFNLQSNVMNIFSDYCRSKFYMTFQRCVEYPKWDDSLVEMFSKINRAKEDDIRHPEKYFASSPSPILKPFVVTETSGNCNNVTNDEDCPISMLKYWNETTFTVSMDKRVFKYHDRIRVDEIRVFLVGLRHISKEVELVLGHYGGMMDRYEGEEYKFLTEPGQFLFSYHSNSGDLTKAACVSAQYSNSLTQITPFTQWYVKVLDPEQIDLSSVSALEVYFLGTSIFRSEGMRKRDVDARELQYRTQGLAELTRGCGGD